MRRRWLEIILWLLIAAPLIFLLRHGLSFEDRIVSTFGTTLSMTCVVIMLNLLLAYPAGKRIALHDGRATHLFELLISLPLFTPIILISFGLYFGFIRTGLSDTFLGVALVLLLPTLPYSVRMFANGFSAIGEAMLEQMVNFVPGRVRRFFLLTGPMLESTIQSVVLFVTVITISQYALVTLVGGGVVRMISLEAFPLFSDNDREAGRAIVWMLLLPAMLYGIQRLLFQGWKYLLRRHLG
ncbi:ABC transporter permease [Exiguobacterium flavidum]|uniref:ABC transporter permease n=1 Tax=Exiguobacterium flavidum TaxID=2184695 RepID=UPI000DF81B9A|nr:ABC transporter permease [Exiguobacterium flavidum]